MRVVVTGGTGFVGRALVRRLLAEGHGVRILTRDVARAAVTAAGARAPHRARRPVDGRSWPASGSSRPPRHELGFRFRYPTIDTALAECCAEPRHEESWEQWLPAPPEAVFPFFSDPRNLEAITPDFLRFRVLRTSTSSDAGRHEDRLSAVTSRLPLRWQSVIEAWEPPRRFVDRQTRGPYTLWHHTHEFEPRDGGTLIRDRVRWAVPLGALGDLVAGGWVARDVDAIFAFRRAKLAAIFGGGHDAPAAARGLQA